MNKYIYADCSQDYWPEIRTINANSYNQAVEKVINNYATELDDEEISNFNTLDELRDYLNETYTIAISDIEDIEEL